MSKLMFDCLNTLYDMQNEKSYLINTMSLYIFSILRNHSKKLSVHHWYSMFQILMYICN